MEECEAYGTSIGEWTRVDSWDIIPTGCFRNSGSLTDTKVYFNTNPNTLPCTTDRNCIQKVPNKALKITATGYGITYKGYDPYHCTHSANVRSQLDLSSYDIFTCAQGDVKWAEFVKVSSGAPDLSVSEAECYKYAVEHDFHWSPGYTNTVNPSGCFLIYSCSAVVKEK